MRNYFQDIKERIKIENLIGSYIKLRRTGKAYIGKCPFHSDNNPSFYVEPVSQRFKCWGCNISGDVFDFYSKYFNKTLDETVLELSDYINASYLSKKVKNIEKQNAYKANSFSQKIFGPESEYIYYERINICQEDRNISETRCKSIAEQSLLTFFKQIQIQVFTELVNFCLSHPDPECDEYLVGSTRGLSRGIISKYKLCSFLNWKSLVDHLKNKFTEEELLISGLFLDDGNFLFKYNNILIPYIENQQIVYVRARRKETKNISNRKKYPKYLSPLNRTGTLYSKRFYNIDLLIDLSKGSELFLCEGEFDCLMFIKNGIPAIAIPGVNNLPNISELEVLKNFQIYLLMDNDIAGRKALFQFKESLHSILKNYHTLTLKTKHKDMTEWFLSKRKLENF